MRRWRAPFRSFAGVPTRPAILLRQRARCSACGRKGATLQHPGWGGATSASCRFRRMSLRRRPPEGDRAPYGASRLHNHKARIAIAVDGLQFARHSAGVIERGGIVRRKLTARVAVHVINPSDYEIVLRHRGLSRPSGRTPAKGEGSPYCLPSICGKVATAP